MSRGSMRHRGLLGAATIALGVALAMPAAAQSKSEEKFTFEITPYLWTAGISGDISIGTIATKGVDVSFSSIFDNLDLAFMGWAEARYGRFGLIVDAIYMDIGKSVPIRDNRGEASAKFEQQMYSIAPSYRVLDEEVLVDVLAGVRYLYMKSRLAVPPGGHPLIATGRTVSASESWVGGFVGTAVAWPLPFYKPVSLIGYVDVGVMDGNFMWQGIAGANWQISQMFSAKLGYRYLSVDVDAGRAQFDLAMGGFFAGLGIKF